MSLLYRYISEGGARVRFRLIGDVDRLLFAMLGSAALVRNDWPELVPVLEKALDPITVASACPPDYYLLIDRVLMETFASPQVVPI